MHIRGLTAISLLAAMGVMAGCEGGDTADTTATDDTAYRESGEQAPAPESSVPGTQEPTGGEDLAGADEPMTTTEPGQTTPTTEPGQPGQPMGMTEFAALDTDSDGKLVENEWQPDAVQGMQFDEIDEDASGDIDQEEFRQAIAQTGQQMQESLESGAERLNPTDQQ